MIITINTKNEYKFLLEKIQKFIKELDVVALKEFKDFIGTSEEEIFDIEYRPISSISDEEFPRAINFRFQIADETFLSWEETLHLKKIEDKLLEFEKTYKALKKFIE